MPPTLTTVCWQISPSATSPPCCCHHAFLLSQGALTSIYLASSPEVEGVTGKYFDKCRPIPSTPLSYDLDVAVKLWDRSQELVAAKAKVPAAAV